MGAQGIGGGGLPGIVQLNLLIPPAIQAGLDAGDLLRNGSVVRDSLGKFVTFLDEVPGVKEAQEAAKRAALRLTPRIIIPVVVVTALAGGAAVVRTVMKRKQTAEPAGGLEVVIPECVQNFDASLRAYLEAAGEGGLDVAIIDQLVSDLDAVRTYSDDGSVAVPFSLAQLETVFSLVIDHTQKLAKAYSVDLHEVQEQAPGAGAGAGDDKVIDLRRHLETQRRIIDQAA